MKYQKGQSGNPAGKPKGSGDKRLQLRRALEEKGLEVVETLLEMAIVDKEPTAIKIIMDRISPKPKSDSVNLELGDFNLKTIDDMKDMMYKILEKAIHGELPDEQGKSISSICKTIFDVEAQAMVEEQIKSRFEASKS